MYYKKNKFENGIEVEEEVAPEELGREWSVIFAQFDLNFVNGNFLS